MPRDFVPCMYDEVARADIEDLSWYIRATMTTLEEGEMSIDSRVFFLEDWDDEGHDPPSIWTTHAMRRQWLRETLETLLYTAPLCG